MDTHKPHNNFCCSISIGSWSVFIHGMGDRKKVISPDKKSKIYITFSGSETGPAPYGTYLFVAARLQPFPYHYKEPFAAGYFENNLNVEWQTNKNIEISGRAEKILVKKEKVGPVTISYVIK